MARLRSEEGNNPTFFEIKPGGFNTVTGSSDEETWQEVSLLLTSGGYVISGGAAQELTLCRSPKDEVAILISELDDLLKHKRSKVMFEPSEPSFEINFERTSYGALRVDVWIDAGNAATGFYTYDAVGIRFLTTDEHVGRFTKQLKEEFSNVQAESSA